MEILVSILVTMNQLPGEGPKRALAKSCVCVCVCVKRVTVEILVSILVTMNQLFKHAI